MLQLAPLEYALREAVLVDEEIDADPIPAATSGDTSSVWLFASAGALQRFAVSSLDIEQQTAVAAQLRGMRLEQVPRLPVCICIVLLRLRQTHNNV